MSAQPKFTPPRLDRYIHRPRLFDLVDHGVRKRVTLVRAPAGAGKTTLLAAWFQQRAPLHKQLAWLTLDEWDNDPIRLCGNLVRAIDGCLANRPTVLVVDDFQVVTAPRARTVLRQLIRDVPAELHLIVATRHLPEADLARPRAAENLTKIEFADLAFSVAETAELLRSRSSSPNLGEIDRLQRQTRGWAVGLLLGNPLPAAPPNPVLVNYLRRAVIGELSETDQDFLLRLSVVDRLSAALATSLTGLAEAAVPLRRLATEHGLLRTVSRSAPRDTWFEHNPLLRQALRRELAGRLAPAEVADLHRRAAIWYSTNGLPTAAVEQAQAAACPELAINELRRNIPLLCAGGLTQPAIAVIRKLPNNLVDTDPSTALVAAVACALGKPEVNVEPTLDEVAAMFNGTADKSTADLAIGICRLARHLRGGEVDAGLRLARQLTNSDGALPHSSTRDQVTRTALVLPYQGALHWIAGDIPAARADLHRGQTAAEQARLRAAALHCRVRLLEIERVVPQDDYPTAELHRLRAIISEQPWREQYPLTLLDLHNAWLLWQQDDLAGAAVQLSQLTLQPQHLTPVEQAETTMVRAAVQLSLGEPGRARALLESELGARADHLPVVADRLTALRIRISLALGERPSVADLCREAVLPGLDLDLSLVAAHVAALRGDIDAALQRLRSLLSADARISGSRRAAIWLEVAHSHWLNRSARDTLGALREAIIIASASEHRRIFLDQRSWTKPLLVAYATTSDSHDDFVHDLIDSMRDRDRATSRSTGTASPLTEREGEILQLLATSLTITEIAEQMFISVNTVKSHLKNLYRKLRANGRPAAVRTAKDIGLL